MSCTARYGRAATYAARECQRLVYNTRVLQILWIPFLWSWSCSIDPSSLSCSDYFGEGDHRADDAICTVLEYQCQQLNGAPFLLTTDDRGLGSQAERLGASIMSINEFYALVRHFEKLEWESGREECDE